jgi:hypothetical protein
MIARCSQGMTAERRAVRGRAPSVRAIRLVLLVFAVAALSLPASARAYVYWANYGTGTTIGRANLDGTGANQSFITAANVPTGVAVDG